MKKLLLVFLALLFLRSVSLYAQDQRVVAVPKPAEYYQTRLERLYKAIDVKDQTAAVARYERDLMAAMREAIEAAGSPAEGSTEARFKQEMIIILQKFEGFSFVNAAKSVADEHLALMESFLGMMIK
jgi:hypothetical protein